MLISRGNSASLQSRAGLWQEDPRRAHQFWLLNQVPEAFPRPGRGFTSHPHQIHLHERLLPALLALRGLWGAPCLAGHRPPSSISRACHPSALPSQNIGPSLLQPIYSQGMTLYFGQVMAPWLLPWGTDPKKVVRGPEGVIGPWIRAVVILAEAKHVGGCKELQSRENAKLSCGSPDPTTAPGEKGCWRTPTQILALARGRGDLRHLWPCHGFTGLFRSNHTLDVPPHLPHLRHRSHCSTLHIPGPSTLTVPSLP